MSGRGMDLRVGLGFDAHRFARDRALVLGGVTVREKGGLEGHSDADVLTHAIIDALLGACGLGDIGTRFPDTDAAFKDAESVVLLGSVVQLLHERGWRPVNVDAVVVCEEPKVAPYRPAICEGLARAMDMEVDAITVKGTTTEGMGFTGRGEGICAQAVALVERFEDPASPDVTGQTGTAPEQKG